MIWLALAILVVLVLLMASRLREFERCRDREPAPLESSDAREAIRAVVERRRRG